MSDTSRPMRAIALAVCAGSALLLAACASAPDRPVASHAATLRVRQEWVPGALYAEGSYSYVRVERDGHQVVQVRLTNARTPRATIRLDPGSYRLVSFQRPCDGNCQRLDPPTDRCSQSVDVKAEAVMDALVRLSPGQGCTIEFRID